MTNAPGDLLDLRHRIQAVTGLMDPADVGIVGDGAHARTGGYHEGRDVLVFIDRYHAGASPGALTEDYSARLARDRAGLSDDASAMDVADDWPRGGRAAWLRWNNLLVAELRAGRPELAAIRAVNYSPDGSARRRTDREHGWAVEDSSDLVEIHTHLEWYRDTAGRRVGCFDRLIVLMQAAIANRPPSTLGDRMIVMAHERGSSIDWIGDGVYRYRCPDAAHRANALVVMSLQGNPNPTSVEFNPGTLDALGPVIVSATDGVPTTNGMTASVVMTQTDRDAIVAALMNSVPTAAQIATAVLDEQHRRDAA